MTTASQGPAFACRAFTKEQYAMARQSVMEERPGTGESRISLAMQISARATWIGRAVRELEEASAIVAKWKPNTHHV